MIDAKGKLFGKINVFDFIVILLLILLVFGVVFKFVILNPKTQASTVEVTYQAKIESVRDVTANAFSVGDIVSDYLSQEKVGVITDIATTQATDLMETLDGTVVHAPIEERYDVILTIQGTAEKQENGNLMMGTYKLVEGGDLRVSTLLTNCVSSVQNVQWK